IEVDEKLTSRDLKDYWLADEDHLKTAQKRLTKKEKQLGDSELYSALVKKVKKKEIDFDDQELKVVTIFTRLNGTQELTTNFIKNQDVTDDEIARIGENSKKLQGISTGMDWTRDMVTN